MRTKFEEQFFSGENKKYLNIIKYISSEFNEEENSIRIKFLVDARDYNMVIESLETIKSKCKEITKLENVSIEIVRTYVDEEMIKSTVLQSIREITNMNMLILGNMEDDDISAEISKDCIKCIIKIQEAYIAIFKDKILDKLKENVVNKFPKSIEILPYMIKNRIVNGERIVRTNKIFSAIRQIPFECKQKIVGSNRVDNLTNKFAQYIRDIKPINDRRVLVCGTVKNSQLKHYIPKAEKVKKEVDPEYQPMEKSMLQFDIWDTNESDSIKCVFFLNENNMKRSGEILDGIDIAIDGVVNVFNDRASIKANEIFYASIDKTKIYIDEGKPAPEFYKTIIPEKYSVEIQGELGMNTDAPLDLKNMNIVIFDLETTGLDVLKDEVIDFAAIKIIGGKVVEKLEGLFNPGRKISNEVVQLTTITNKMLEGKPQILDAIGDVYKFFDNCVICGYNSDAFDIPLIKKYYKLAGYNFKNKTIDTYILSKKFLKLSSYKLTDIASNFGFGNPNAHRALADVEMTYKLLLKLYDVGYRYGK